MTVSIMDGSTGEAHVTSDDWAAFNEATYGVREGVFDWGGGLALEMQTANNGVLSTGAALVAGRRVRVTAPERVTIDSGGQGVMRHDVVGIQYEAYESGRAVRERAVAKVVKGTPQAGSAADPGLPEGFLPLWRVPLDGLNVGEPVALAARVPTAASVLARLDFRERAEVGGVVFERRGTQVDVMFAGSLDISGEWGEEYAGTVPERFRPLSDRTFPCAVQQSGHPCTLVLQPDGLAKFRSLGGGAISGWVFCSGSYSVRP